MCTMIAIINNAVLYNKNFLKRVQFQCSYLPGASLGDPTHDKDMWKRPDKQGFRTRGAPWTCIYPITRICLSYYFVPFTNSPDVQGAIPDNLSLEKINLGL